MARLPKAENAIIAEHEAGKHDVYNGGYSTKGPQPETCRECAKRAKAEAEAALDTLATAAKAPNRPAKPLKPLPGEPGPRSLAKLLVINPTGNRAGKTRRRPATVDGPMPKVVEPKTARKPKGVKVDTNAPVVIAKPAAAPILGAIVVPEGGYGTREAWMLAAVEAFRPWFAEEAETLPPVRISVGWPGGRGNKQHVLGQCWAASAVGDGIPAIFVTPTQSDPVEVLETILHEGIHAAGHMHHRRPFQKVAHKFGFVNGGKTKTSREQSPDLYATLDEMAAALGPFPHSAVTSAGGLAGGDPTGPPVQSTRMLKVWCDNDGYTLRATKKWLQVAIPACPVCEAEMQVDWK